MRLQSVTVRNYRVHRDRTVQLDQARTLIGGPNESGKSTLVEAVHRGLFLKSTVTGSVQKSMVSTSFAGAPEIEIHFSAGGFDYLVTKRFSGAAGTTRLARVGGQTWQGDEAETRLASLLKVEAVGGGRGVGERVAQQWSHLWVWQGQGGGDPSAHANLQREGLLQRLQHSGGAAALQSEMDARVAAQFAAAKNEIFTQAGKPKVGSALEHAETEADQAELERQRAAERIEKLRGSVRDFEEATRTIAEATKNLQGVSQQKETNELKLSRVAELRRQEERQHPDAKTAADRYQALRQSEDQITALRAKIQTLQSALQPKMEQAKHLAAAWENARQMSGEAAQAYDQAARHTREVRLRRDLAAAWVGRFEKEVRLQELLVRDGVMRGHQEELARGREELVKLPEITASKLKKLQKLETEVSQSEAALKAMAAGIEVLAASVLVRVGDASMAIGQSQIITEPTEITVGETLRLRISPGGGTSLQAARSEAQESRRSLQEELDELVIASVAEAAEALARRKDLSSKIEHIESALKGLDAANLPGTLADAREAAAASAAEVDRRLPQVANPVLPATAADARSWLSTEERAVDEAETEEAGAKARRNAAEKSFATAETSLTQHRQNTELQNSELTGLKAQGELLLQTHGEDAARALALAVARSAQEDTAQALLSATRQALAELQPDLLEADRGRLQRAGDQAGATKRDAEDRRVVAQAALQSDGMEDPEAALALAEARAGWAQDRLASVRRKAEALRLLDQLFLEEQRTLAEQFTRPFAERISAYLQCLFGVGTSAAVTLADNAFQAIQLVRPTQGGGAVQFDHLSGGAREQVAAAVRLAMAEVLAADHDGCLPLVFDDAFAYSDPDRVQTLQRMLDLAVARGLQIIILTCNPSDYAALGARQVFMGPEPTSSGLGRE